MPTYDYHCKSCKHRFEQFQSMKDGALRKCPKCGKSTLERLIGTGAAVIFKGTGFYQTDYRSDSYNTAKKADTAASSNVSSSDSKSGSEAKSDSGGSTSATPDKPAKPEPAKPAPAKSDSQRRSKKNDD